MLVEQNPTDKRFEELLGYIPELSPALRKIDEYLEDEKLYKLIRADLAKRYPKTKETGRNSTSVEVVLRMLVVTGGPGQLESASVLPSVSAGCAG